MIASRPISNDYALMQNRDWILPFPEPVPFTSAQGREVRLRCAYWVRCNEFITDADAHPIKLLCTDDPRARDGNNPPLDAEGKVRKVKGTLHWVADADCALVEVRLFDHLTQISTATFKASRKGPARKIGCIYSH
jgi:hypothetical protein